MMSTDRGAYIYTDGLFPVLMLHTRTSDSIEDPIHHVIHVVQGQHIVSVMNESILCSHIAELQMRSIDDLMVYELGSKLDIEHLIVFAAEYMMTPNPL